MLQQIYFHLGVQNSESEKSSLLIYISLVPINHLLKMMSSISQSIRRLSLITKNSSGYSKRPNKIIKRVCVIS